MTLALEVDRVDVVYGSGSQAKKAVDGLSLDVKEGEFFGLLGPNGAGKTSLISVVTGMVSARQGSCRVFSAAAGSLEARRCLGYVPQELVHHGFFSVNEILNYFSGYYGYPDNQDRIDYLLEKLALEDVRDKRVNTLSGGMKRRLLICKALVHSPRLLLLDEPSAGVDIELRAQLWQFVEELNRAGTTIILTTHYLEEAQRLCSRVGIMDHGKLLALDDTGHLISSLAEKILYLKLESGSPAPYLKDSKAGIHIEKIADTEWKLNWTSELDLKRVFELTGVHWQSIKDIRMESGSLEEAFVKVLRGAA